jgi:hypothetical protein
MTYLARLKALLAEKPLPEQLTERTEASSISFVGEQGGQVSGDEAEIEERAGIAADRVPAVYLDAWARLNCQKPFHVSDAE